MREVVDQFSLIFLSLSLPGVRGQRHSCPKLQPTSFPLQMQASRPPYRLSDGTAHSSSSLAAGRGVAREMAHLQVMKLVTRGQQGHPGPSGDARRRKLLSHPSPRHRGSEGARFRFAMHRAENPSVLSIIASHSSLLDLSHFSLLKLS